MIYKEMKVIDRVKDDKVKTVPFSLLNENSAQKNHSQSLDKLNSRGGLSFGEMFCNIMRLDLRFLMDNFKLPYKFLIQRLLVINKPKQFTINEFRDQYESYFMGGVSVKGRIKNKSGEYSSPEVAVPWQTWLWCGRVNNLIKDGDV